MDDHGLRQHEPQIRHLEFVGVRVRDALHETHPVVAHEAHRSAQEAGQIDTFEGHRPHLSEALAQYLEGVSRDLETRRARCVPPLHAAAARLEDGPCAGADEAVAAPFFAALHRLEEEAGGAIIELAEQRHRCVEVHQQLPNHRHEVSSRGEIGEHLLGRAEQGGLRPLAWGSTGDAGLGGKGSEFRCDGGYAWAHRASSKPPTSQSSSLPKPVMR